MTTRRILLAQERDPSRSSLLGVASFTTGIITAAVVAIGMFTAVSGGYAAATGLAYFAIAVSIFAVGSGLFGVLLGRGRGWAIAGILIGGLASPIVLTRILQFFSGSQ